MNVLSKLLAVLLGIISFIVGSFLGLLILPFVIVAKSSTWIAKSLEPRYKEWADLVEFDDEFGWKPVANMNSWHMVDEIYKTNTDKDGWRGSQKIEDADIVVVGDSFAWGYGIADKDFFAELPNDINVKAIGCVGYNMVQELMWIRKLAPIIQGNSLVWMIFWGNDPYDNMAPHMNGYRTPFVCKKSGAENWEIRTDHISESRWFVNTRQSGEIYLDKVNELCRHGYYSDRALDACKYLIAKGAETCRDAGIELVVVTVPDRAQYDLDELFSYDEFSEKSEIDPELPDKVLRDWCQTNGIAFVATMDLMDLSDFKMTDCHWNESGHSKFAGFLNDLCHEERKQKVLQGLNA